MNNIEQIYIKGLIEYLKKEINFKHYDTIIEQSNLYFGKSNTLNNKLSSYLGLKNIIYLENLSNDIKEKLLAKELSNDKLIEIISSTYKKAITKKDTSKIMYNPPMPSHLVNNGSLVFELVYGKNKEKVEDNKYKDLIIKQKAVINKVIKELKEEIKNKLNVELEIFIEKRI